MTRSTHVLSLETRCITFHNTNLNSPCRRSEIEQGNLDSLEELTLRGKEALLSRGVSPRELEEFDAQMQAYAVSLSITFFYRQMHRERTLPYSCLPLAISIFV